MDSVAPSLIPNLRWLTRCPTGINVKLQILFAFLGAIRRCIAANYPAPHSCSTVTGFAADEALTLRKNRVAANRPALESRTPNTLSREAHPSPAYGGMPWRLQPSPSFS